MKDKDFFTSVEISQHPTETNCEKCSCKAFDENLIHDPAILVRHPAN